MLMKQYFAKSDPPVRNQTHLQKVSVFAAQYGREIGQEETARIAGLFHDFGKNGERFAGVLQGIRRNIDHALPGAAFLYTELRLNRRETLRKKYGPILEAISAHHDGLQSLGRLEPYLIQALTNPSDTVCPSGKTAALSGLAEYENAAQAFRRDFPDFRFPQLPDAEAASNLETMLDILDWNAGDRYLCLKFRSQDSGIAVRSDSALRGILAGLLQHCASFYFQQQLCAVVNLTRSRQSPHAIRLRLAPHIRDSYMFGGISSPVCGIHALPDGFRQTELALQAAARRGQWLLSFSDCALDYIQHCAEACLPPSLLAAPVLLELRQYDGSHGTQYYETLRAYLLHERSIPRTAEALIIHRTTLTYRLGKLEELWSLNLDDSDTRLYLLLSFRMLDAGREP